MHVYTDLDWGSDKITRRPTTGVLIIMAGGQSSGFRSFNLSSMEAEYVTCILACRTRQLLKNIDLERTRPAMVFNDNQSAHRLP